MKQPYLIALVILSALLVPMSQAFADDNAKSNHETISVDAVTEFVEQNENVVILDVRTPAEYDISHVPGAININVQDELFIDVASRLDSHKTYIVYCTKNPVGGRSMTALGKLQELGFRDLYSMQGGHIAWSEARLPMTKKEE
jgi:rhodanese-related sulfurtransferase